MKKKSPPTIFALPSLSTMDDSGERSFFFVGGAFAGGRVSQGAMCTRDKARRTSSEKKQSQVTKGASGWTRGPVRKPVAEYPLSAERGQNARVPWISEREQEHGTETLF